MESITVSVAGLLRTVPLVHVSDSRRIAYLDFMCDAELIAACAERLASDLEFLSFGSIIAPACGSIPLTINVARLLDVPYIVLRKLAPQHAGPYGLPATIIPVPDHGTLVLEHRYLSTIRRAPVVIVDSVLASGNTLRMIAAALENHRVQVAAKAVAVLQGNIDGDADVLHVARLPTY
jgi:adenine/guanine phosphoribosyltransferase-like PRPP-binding protein